MEKSPLYIWRQANGMSQTDVAKVVGVTTPTISRIESGVNKPSPTVAAAIEKMTGGEIAAMSLLVDAG